jgi:hypothetical protein
MLSAHHEPINCFADKLGGRRSQAVYPNHPTLSTIWVYGLERCFVGIPERERCCDPTISQPGAMPFKFGSI